MEGLARRLRVLALLAACGLPGAGDAGESPPPAAPPGGDAAPGAPFAWVAPTRIDGVGRILAPVSVNGAGPFAFVVDTGASRSAIAPKLVTALNLEAVPDAAVILRGITGTEQVPLIRVDRLEFGGLTLRDQLLPVVRPGIFANADGILGVEGLQGSCVRVDFLKQTIAIDRGRCPRAGSGWLRVPGKLRFGGLLTVQGRIGRTRVAIIVDTGAERTLGNAALLEALELQSQAKDPSYEAKVLGATSQSQQGAVIPSPTIRIAGVSVTRTQVIFGEFEVFTLWGLEGQPALLLGMDVLGAADGLMVDYARAELGLLPTGSALRPRSGTRFPGSRLP
jgi:predicted aspartyl protease